MKKHVTLALSLREEPFFRDFSPKTISKIENCVYHREYEPRQIVYFPDDPCDYVYWVRQGRIKITRVSPDGRELTFRHLFPGDLLGEECLIEPPKRGVYAEAMDTTVLCLMPAPDFVQITREDKEFSNVLAAFLCQRAIHAEEVLAETVFKPVRSRIAAGLLRLHERAPDTERGCLRVTHQEIASLVGSTRETTTAVLHELRQEGIIDMANRRVTVLDPAALDQAARSG